MTQSHYVPSIRPFAALLAGALILAGCTTAPHFDNPTNAGSGALVGGVVNPSSPIYFQQTVGDRVFFSVDEFRLTPEAEATLASQADWLKTNPEYTVIVEGHADERGTREYNLALAAKRANEAMEFLVSLGVPRDRLEFVSFGKERPLELCSVETCYSANRRAVSIVTASVPVL